MIHPAVALRHVNDVIGYGVYATAPIPRGTVTWQLDPLDLVFTREQAARLGPIHRPVLEKYSYVDQFARFVLCWDFGRYMNHACLPNTRGVGNFEVAVRDIAPGDEITCEYATLNLSHGFRCACGHPACRGEVGPNDAVRFAARWDAEFRAAMRDFAAVPQPLLALVHDDPVNAVALRCVRSGRFDALPSVASVLVAHGLRSYAGLSGGAGPAAAAGAGPWALPAVGA